MFAVIDHKQQLPFAQRLDEARQRRSNRRIGDAKRGGYETRHQARICDRSQLHQPDTVSKVLVHRARYLQRETALAHPTWPRDCHMRRTSHQLALAARAPRPPPHWSTLRLSRRVSRGRRSQVLAVRHHRVGLHPWRDAIRSAWLALTERGLRIDRVPPGPNAVIGENDRLDAVSLPLVQMPNRSGFLHPTHVPTCPRARLAFRSASSYAGSLVLGAGFFDHRFAELDAERRWRDRTEGVDAR